MKIITFASWKSMDDFIAGKPADLEVSEGWGGIAARLDRSAQGAAKNARDVAQNNAATAGSDLTSDRATLDPFFTQEMNAQHLFNPGQANELLTAAEAPIGSVAGDTAHAAELQSARTRNASGFAKDLQLANRDKMKAAAGASEGVAAQDVLGAKQLNQQGAAGMSDLFKTDQQRQLESMGLENQDINTQLQAGKSGWLQNLNSTIDAASGLIGGLKKK